MSLEEWARNDWLKPHKTNEKEIKGLLSIVKRELKDGDIVGISSDGKFTHAYHAVLTLATILLYKAGYEPAHGQSHHYRTIEAMGEILVESKSDIAYLQNCRAKRNAAEYDAANEATETEAKELMNRMT